MVTYQRCSHPGPIFEILTIKGFSQSISWCNFLAAAQWGFSKACRGEGQGPMGHVQEVPAHSAAGNEYHGRQSKHDTTGHSSNHTL